MSEVDDTVSGKGAHAVSVSDSTDLQVLTRGIYVGVSGNIKVTMQGGDVITFVGVAAGVVHPLKCKRVWSTGTTATDIVAVY